MRGLCVQDSNDFSKYLRNEDKSSLYNYSNSYNSQTLLLQTTEIHHKNKPFPQQTVNVLQQNDLNLSRFLLEDLYGQLQATVSNGQIGSSKQQTKKGLNDLYNTCQQLICTIKKLENKVERMQESDPKSKDTLKQSDWSGSNKQIQSILTYSSLKSSKGSKGSKICHCDSDKNKSNILVNNLIEYMEYKSKLQIYKQENQKLKRQVIQLQVNNGQMKKYIKKIQGQNSKIKELLKQYQNFNKKQITKNQSAKNFIGDNIQQKRVHVRSNTYDQEMGSPYTCTFSKKNNEQEKQNIKQLLECKIKDEEMCQYNKKSPMTPNPLLRTIKSATQCSQIRNSFGQNRQIQQRMQCLSQKVGQLLDYDNQKTQSKSKQRKIKILKQRNNKINSQQPLFKYYNSSNNNNKMNGQRLLFEQQNYQIQDKYIKKRPILQQMETMVTLPDYHNLLQLKRFKSANTKKYISTDQLSPIHRKKIMQLK